MTMATVHITFTQLESGNGASTNGTVMDGAQIVSEMILNPTTSAATTATALLSDPRNVAMVTVIGGAVWLAFGEAPTAAVGGAGSVYVPEGSTLYVALRNGWKVAAINA